MTAFLSTRLFLFVALFVFVWVPFPDAQAAENDGFNVDDRVACLRAGSSSIHYPGTVVTRTDTIIGVKYSDTATTNVASISECFSLSRMPSITSTIESDGMGVNAVADCDYQGAEARVTTYPGIIIARQGTNLTVHYSDDIIEKTNTSHCKPKYPNMTCPPSGGTGECAGVTGAGGNGGSPLDGRTDVRSASQNTDHGIRLINALQADSLEDLITDIIDAIVQLGSVLLVLGIVWTGFLFATATGKEEKIKQAREAFFWCVIGGLVLIGAAAISAAIKGIVSAL